jgi:hypothetical protein
METMETKGEIRNPVNWYFLKSWITSNLHTELSSQKSKDP